MSNMIVSDMPDARDIPLSEVSLGDLPGAMAARVLTGDADPALPVSAFNSSI